MERYYSLKRKQSESDTPIATQMPTQESTNLKQSSEDCPINHEIELPTYPAKRKSIDDFDANDKDRVKRYYLQQGSCQPNTNFPWRSFGNENRRLWSPIDNVLEHVAEHTDDNKLRGNAELMLVTMNTFDFVFYLHLLKNILGVSNELSRALQRNDQDIVNAMNLVNATRRLFRKMKENGWETLLSEVVLFCQKYNIDVVDMSQKFVDPRKKLRMAEELTNEHHYRIDKFIAILDRQIRELDDRFGEVGTELLLSMCSLDPKDSFEAFDQEKLIKFAKFYPREFSEVNLMELEWSLYTYFEDVSHDRRFIELGGIAGLAKKMVETGKDLVHPTVYKLLKLALLLPVATAGVERSFSAMNIIKTRLRNRIEDEWLNDLLVTYIEREIFITVTNEDIIQRFQNMKSRRGVLNL